MENLGKSITANRYTKHLNKPLMQVLEEHNNRLSMIEDHVKFINNNNDVESLAVVYDSEVLDNTIIDLEKEVSESIAEPLWCQTPQEPVEQIELNKDALDKLAKELDDLEKMKTLPEYNEEDEQTEDDNDDACTVCTNDIKEQQQKIIDGQTLIGKFRTQEIVCKDCCKLYVKKKKQQEKDKRKLQKKKQKEIYKKRKQLLELEQGNVKRRMKNLKKGISENDGVDMAQNDRLKEELRKMCDSSDGVTSLINVHMHI